VSRIPEFLNPEGIYVWKPFNTFKSQWRFTFAEKEQTVEEEEKCSEEKVNPEGS